MAEGAIANVKIEINDLLWAHCIQQTALADELRVAIERYIDATRDMEIKHHDGSYYLQRRRRKNTELGLYDMVHVSASYTACVEFALNSPETQE